jgi:hypothetical protein
MLQSAVREEILAVLDEFSRRLALPPEFAVRVGATSNNSFPLRAYVLGERSDGTEVAVTVDVRVQDGVLRIESDICRDDGYIYKGGPSFSTHVENDKQAQVLFDRWMKQFRKYLEENQSDVSAWLRS